jgi:hypothetical protein
MLPVEATLPDAFGYAQYERPNVRYWMASLRWRGCMLSAASRSHVHTFYNGGLACVGFRDGH